MDLFTESVAYLSMIFLVLSCIEVGSNDATNLVNAVFGSRVLRRKTAVIIAGVFVILGATFSSPVIDTVRKGIFDIGMLDTKMTLTVFISAYLVGTILLYIYSLFGMPVSTTATLVFCLAGGAIGALGSTSVIHWAKFGKIVLAIFMSIFLSGFFAYMVQRALRKMIGANAQDHHVILKHGPWITGFMFVALFWFMFVKGMKHVFFVQSIGKDLTSDHFILMFVSSWFMVSASVYGLLKVFGRRASHYLFHVVAIVGMCCMAFAFGQNDLANCASPGIAILMIWTEGLVNSVKVSTPIWALSFCGFLMFLGMLTKRAQRVTRAEVNTASQSDNVKLYAPSWCQSIASYILSWGKHSSTSEISFSKKRDKRGKKLHYDALRASVILSVSACVIAFASSMALPVSTTYVAFAAVVASGWGDKVFSTGSAQLKLGRTVWVISGWFLGAAVAFCGAALASFMIYHTELWGLAISLLTLTSLKIYYKNQGDIHEKIYHKGKKKKSSKVLKNLKDIKTPLRIT